MPSSKLINVTHVKQLALGLCKDQPGSLARKCRVGASFIETIDAEVRAAVSRRLNHHDNKTGGAKTLV